VDFGDGWGLVRASNTTPLLILRFEADTQERLAEIRNLVEAKLAEVMKAVVGA
jgi:phosphomannomutase/phosphoglucomutase